MHTHASLLAGVSSLLAAWEWGPEDRLVLCLPLFHVHGLCAGLFGTLTAGASAVVFDRFDEAAVLGAVPASTMFFGVPTMYHRLAASGLASGARRGSASASRGRRRSPPTCGTGWPPTAWPSWSATA